MDEIRLYVSVPVACFRVAQAREYWESYPCPPPSTVYGMLLSLVGETNRLVHKGAEIAIAALSVPERSVVLRTMWQVKNKKDVPGGDKGNKRPDFQELLTNIKLSVWVRKGESEGTPESLAKRLSKVLSNPASLVRFGGLSLGESTHLVDEARLWRSGDTKRGHMLVPDDQGDLSLPIWADHVGSKGTRWGQFRLEKERVLAMDGDNWITIALSR